GADGSEYSRHLQPDRHLFFDADVPVWRGRFYDLGNLSVDRHRPAHRDSTATNDHAGPKPPRSGGARSADSRHSVFISSPRTPRRPHSWHLFLFFLFLRRRSFFIRSV